MQSKLTRTTESNKRLTGRRREEALARAANRFYLLWLRAARCSGQTMEWLDTKEKYFFREIISFMAILLSLLVNSQAGDNEERTVAVCARAPIIFSCHCEHAYRIIK